MTDAPLILAQPTAQDRGNGIAPLTWDAVRSRAELVRTVYDAARRRPGAPVGHLDGEWRSLAHLVAREPQACIARGYSAVDTTRAMECVMKALDDRMATFTRLRDLPDNQLSVAAFHLAAPPASPPSMPAPREASDLLVRLRARGIQVEADNEGRIILWPLCGAKITDQDRNQVRKLKNELITQIALQPDSEVID